MTITVDEKVWTKVFKQDIKDKLKESKIEYDKYKTTGQIVYLQQAGNKLFSVVENWLMLKYQTRVRSYQELRQLVKNNKHDRRMLSQVAQLHRFYYTNIISGEPDEFDDLYLIVYEKMRGRVR